MVGCIVFCQGAMGMVLLRVVSQPLEEQKQTFFFSRSHCRSLYGILWYPSYLAGNEDGEEQERLSQARLVSLNLMG